MLEDLRFFLSQSILEVPELISEEPELGRIVIDVSQFMKRFRLLILDSLQGDDLLPQLLVLLFRFLGLHQ